MPNSDDPIEMPPPVTIDGDAATSAATHATFSIAAKPSCQQIIKLMAEQAKFLNKVIATVTGTELLSAANPALASLFNASAQLESGAMSLHQLVVQHQQQLAQGGLVGPGASGAGGPGGAGDMGPGRGPQRYN